MEVILPLLIVPWLIVAVLATCLMIVLQADKRLSKLRDLEEKLQQAKDELDSAYANAEIARHQANQADDEAQKKIDKLNQYTEAIEDELARRRQLDAHFDHNAPKNGDNLSIYREGAD